MKKSTGFTLIEMIMVITITGIIAGMVAVFIRAPVEGYVDSVRRAELTDQADVALRRIARDVRLALPNSLRALDTNGDAVIDSFEFVLTQSGGRYRDPADGSTGGNYLKFTAAINPCGNNHCFDVLGALPTMALGDRIVVYNLTTDDVAGQTDGNAYTGDNVATIRTISGNTVTLLTNPFASQAPPLPSPSARFQVVGQNDLVVRYTCTGGALRRFAGCTLATPSVCAGTGALLAGGGTTTTACDIDYQTNVTQRNGLLYIRLALTNSGESITLFNQIHVDNAP